MWDKTWRSSRSRRLFKQLNESILKVISLFLFLFIRSRSIRSEMKLRSRREIKIIGVSVGEYRETDR